MEHLVRSTAGQSEENEVKLSRMDGTQLVPSSLHGQYTEGKCLSVDSNRHTHVQVNMKRTSFGLSTRQYSNAMSSLWDTPASSSVVQNPGDLSPAG